MDANTILKSSMLDILYEHRNKAYGAYQLRINYPKRLGKALGITLCASMLSMLIMSSFTTYKPVPRPKIVIDNILKAPVLAKAKAKKPIKEAGNTVKKSKAITKPNLVDHVPITNAVLSPTGVPNGNTDATNAPSSGIVTSNVPSTSTILTTAPATTPIDTVVQVPLMVYNDVDATYIGGTTALGQYLQLKLGDYAIEDGVAMRVTVSFVIEADGTVTHIKAMNNEDEDFLKKTENAFAKMKKWQPATNKHIPIKTYHTVPIQIMPGE